MLDYFGIWDQEVAEVDEREKWIACTRSLYWNKSTILIPRIVEDRIQK